MRCLFPVWGGPLYDAGARHTPMQERSYTTQRSGCKQATDDAHVVHVPYPVAKEAAVVPNGITADTQAGDHALLCRLGGQ